MLSIFIRVDISNTNIDCNERRRNGPISTNPYRTGHIFPPAALHSLDGAPLLPELFLFFGDGVAQAAF